MKHLISSIANLTAVLVLLIIFALPFYLAQNMTKVAGIKSTVAYIVTSQIEKFPNVTLSQQGEIYKISYTKLSSNQEFQELLILTNPTPQTQTYRIASISGHSRLFFGKDTENRTTQITLPAGSSAPMSLFSDELDQIFSVAFKLETL